MRLSLLMLSAASATLSGCATGSIATLAIGPAIGLGDAVGSGVQATLEYTLLAHDRPSSRSRVSPMASPGTPPETHRHPDERPPHRVGIGALAALTGGWQSGKGGWSSSALAGIDFVPLAFDGAHVNFGVAFGYGVNQDRRGIAFMAPRLGFAVTPWQVANGRIGIGLRMSCQFGVTNSCGPALTATRIEFGK